MGHGVCHERTDRGAAWPVAWVVPDGLPPAVRLTFRPRHRLRHAREFAAVYAARVKKSEGPLTLHTLPNGLDHPRLGLSIGRRVGGAVRRSLLKRHLREAFRSIQHELPVGPEGGYDMVVGSGAHAPLSPDQYRELLLRLVERAHRVWSRRDRRDRVAGSEGA